MMFCGLGWLGGGLDVVENADADDDVREEVVQAVFYVFLALVEVSLPPRASASLTF